ncbi:hypothetical protein DFH09DRAFT_1278381 [Mycena vulgaris]|nr:hypothetical protein DFH09DRAFT_1278381 [Mycena vulgaris]
MEQDELTTFLAMQSCRMEELVAAAHKIIANYSEQLDEAGAKRYDLCNVLRGMLDYAPTTDGSRYVAAVLHIAASKNDKGRSVVTVAKAWFDHLLLPMLYVTEEDSCCPQTPSSRDSQTSTLDSTYVETSDRVEQRDFRVAVVNEVQLAKRENHRCAITGKFDADRSTLLRQTGRSNEVPRGGRGHATMKATHILPLTLRSLKDDGKNPTAVILRDAARTWDMLSAWTQIDLKDLQVRLASPANGIYMCAEEHAYFGAFRFYLKKSLLPGDRNTYEAITLRGLLTTGEPTSTVVFSGDMGIDPPSSEYIAIHAAVAQILHLSGVFEYVKELRLEKERVASLHSMGKADMGQALMAHLASLPGAVLAN